MGATATLPVDLSMNVHWCLPTGFPSVTAVGLRIRLGIPFEGNQVLRFPPLNIPQDGHKKKTRNGIQFLNKTNSINPNCLLMETD